MSALQTNNSQPPCADQPQTVDALCAKHGPYKAQVLDAMETLGRNIVMRCPTCVTEAKEAEAEKQRQEAESRRRHRVADLNYHAGIPKRFQDRSMENYRAESPGQKRAVAVAKRFVESWPEQHEKGTSLILTGGPGTGKTHIACAIGSALMEGHLASVRFSTVTEALRHIKDTYRKDSERTESQAIADLMDYDLLILDEIGVQLGTDHEKLLLFEVLNGRYQHCLPTILLSNLNAADLEAYLGQRVMDRYRECGAVVAFDWQSHRGSK